MGERKLLWFARKHTVKTVMKKIVKVSTVVTIGLAVSLRKYSNFIHTEFMLNVKFILLQGNFLETLNIALNTFEKHFINRNLGKEIFAKNL